MSTLEQKLQKIEALDRHREEQRKKMDGLLQKKRQTEKEIKDLEVVLAELDERLDRLEEECLPGGSGENPGSASQTQLDHSLLLPSSESSMLFSEDVLTDPTSQTQQPILSRSSHSTIATARRPGRVSLDTQLTEPSSQLHSSPILEDNDNEIENRIPFFDYGGPNQQNESGMPNAKTSCSNSNHSRNSGNNSVGGGVGQLEFQTVPTKKKKPPPSHTTTTAATVQRETGPMDRFLEIASSEQDFDPSLPASLSRVASTTARNIAASNNAPATTVSSSHSSTNRFNHDRFPWSAQIQSLLRTTFRINEFREHQKEVINCTLSGEDVFVLMRTGGGKSLTYQLPALFEGRGQSQNGKVTFVISPLLSLIRVCILFKILVLLLE